MERLKRSVVFWLLLAATVAMPASAQTLKKQVFRAEIKSNEKPVGSSIVQRFQTVEYLARTTAYPNFAVTKVSLLPSSGAWEVVLCQNGAPVGDCTYNAANSNNLEIEGSVAPLMIFQAGITARAFLDTLAAGDLTIQLSGGGLELGMGPYEQIF